MGGKRKKRGKGKAGAGKGKGGRGGKKKKKKKKEKTGEPTATPQKSPSSRKNAVWAKNHIHSSILIKSASAHGLKDPHGSGAQGGAAITAVRVVNLVILVCLHHIIYEYTPLYISLPYLHLGSYVYRGVHVYTPYIHHIYTS